MIQRYVKSSTHGTPDGKGGWAGAGLPVYVGRDGTPGAALFSDRPATKCLPRSKTRAAAKAPKAPPKPMKERR